MALSNMLNEPRREITETLAGLAVIGVPVGLDYWFAASWFAPRNPEILNAFWLGLVIGPTFVALGFLAVVCLFFLVNAIHELGDLACDFLAARGFDPRPARPNEKATGERN